MKIIRNYSIVILCLLSGLMIAYHPTLISGFSYVQSDPVDTRFNHYILEHTYQWAKSTPPHQNFWNYPDFYPEENMAGYSDVFLAVAPIYWLWRLLGFMPDTSFQLWVLSIGFINFLMTYLLLRNCFQLNRTPSSIGAYMFAFGNPRIIQASHQQLLPQFFTLVAMYALFKIFAKTDNHKKNQTTKIWIAVLFLSLTAQIYSGFYLGWFLYLVFGITTVWALIIPHYRHKLTLTIKTYFWELLSIILINTFLLYPILSHYLEAANSISLQHSNSLQTTILYGPPHIQSWMDMGEHNWIYGWMHELDLFNNVPVRHEKFLGLGLVTFIVAFLGLYWKRKSATIRLILFVFLTLLILTTKLPNGMTLWTFVYHYLPGAKAVRVVSRGGILMLIPVSIGTALFFQQIRNKQNLLCFILALLCMIEQGSTSLAYEKKAVRKDISDITKLIDTKCKAFLYTPVQGTEENSKYHIDAMWAQMASNIPTLNGYVAYPPRHWNFYNINIKNDEDEQHIEKALSHWTQEKGLQNINVCWIKRTIPAHHKIIHVNRFLKYKNHLAAILDQKNDNVYIELGANYFDEQKLEKAKINYNKAITINPENYEAYWGLTKCFAYEGNIDKKNAMLKHTENTLINVLKKLPKDDPKHQELGWVYIDQGHYDKAEIIFRNFLKNHPEDKDALEGLAESTQRKILNY